MCFEAKEENMKKYLTFVQQLVIGFSKVFFEKVPREKNVRANMFSKLSAGDPMKGTWMESLHKKSINQ